MKKPESICIFGDSTAWGAWDTEKGGWVNRLWLHLAHGSESEEYCEIYNLSVSGGTTKTILERFEKEAKIRNAEALIFQTGGNDAAQDANDNFQISPENFAQNIETIISEAKKITDKIIFIGFKNVDETRSLPIPWAELYYKNSSVEKYDNIIEEICKKNDILFLDLPKLDKVDFADGVHPNNSGHEKIFNRVRDFLIQKGWI